MTWARPLAIIIGDARGIGRGWKVPVHGSRAR
ncbi:hypothetical protein NONI108955_10525 [Nocardia ninae]